MTTYTITDTQVTQFQADAKAISDAIAALVPDPVPNPLQVALDAANATIAQLTVKLQTLGVDISDIDLAVEKAKTDA